MSTHRYPNPERAQRIFMYVVGGLMLVIILGLFAGLIVQFLWNQTIATMGGLAPISFWQAFGVLILAKILFGFGTSSGGYGRFGRKYGRRYGRFGRSGNRDSDESDEDFEDVPAEDKAFRTYWQLEGKSAYEAFLASREGPED